MQINDSESWNIHIFDEPHFEQASQKSLCYIGFKLNNMIKNIIRWRGADKKQLQQIRKHSTFKSTKMGRGIFDYVGRFDNTGSLRIWSSIHCH